MTNFDFNRDIALAYVRQWRGKILAACKYPKKENSDILPEHMQEVILKTRDMRAEYHENKARGDNSEEKPWIPLLAELKAAASGGATEGVVLVNEDDGDDEGNDE